MQTITCKLCGKLFNYVNGIKLCPNCAKQMEDKFADVKEYIYTHHNATIQEVSKEFEIPVQQIQKWIRDERLSFSEDSPFSIQCESCGAPIKTGRFCVDCKKRLETGFGSLYQQAPAEKKKPGHEKEKMRFINR